MTVYITFVLDETGSMSSNKEETIAGFNNYILDLNKDLTDVKFSLLKFDSYKMNWVHKGVALKDVDLLNEDTYNPRASTPLWDAFGLAIEEMESVARKKEDMVIISVLTDGHENASTRFTVEQVKGLIDKHPKWAINFLGANMDAWADVGVGLGMPTGSTLTYNANQPDRAFTAASIGTIAYVNSGGMSATGGSGGGGGFFDNDNTGGGGGGVDPATGTKGVQLSGVGASGKNQEEE